MAKIHNQKLLEDNVARCDTLAAGLIERRDALAYTRAEICVNQKNEVLAYIFGESEDNPLEDTSNYIKDDLVEYKARCAEMTLAVLQSSKKEKVA